CIDTSGNGSPSSSMVTGTTLADTIHPTAPTNLTVVSVTRTSVTLSWTASTDNVGIKNYTISNVTDLKNIDTGSNNTTYTVTGLQPNKSYSFAVQCLDTSGNGSPSSTMISARTLQ
ncbi:MAG TPA: fibronectin type III domain-containing protein, partial [Clostridia bacterium]